MDVHEAVPQPGTAYFTGQRASVPVRVLAPPYPAEAFCGGCGGKITHDGGRDSRWLHAEREG